MIAQKLPPPRLAPSGRCRPLLATSFIRGSRRPPMVVVKPAENGTHDDPRSGAVVHRRRQRNMLFESLMRSGATEIVDVLVEHRAEMVLAKNDDVFETLQRRCWR